MSRVISFSFLVGNASSPNCKPAMSSTKSKPREYSLFLSAILTNATGMPFDNTGKNLAELCEFVATPATPRPRSAISTQRILSDYARAHRLQQQRSSVSTAWTNETVLIGRMHAWRHRNRRTWCKRWQICQFSWTPHLQGVPSPAQKNWSKKPRQYINAVERCHDEKYSHSRLEIRSP